ncbi:MAG: hypothetical protein FWG79_08910, partial [Bacteroidales bacterium]|nr:hypothetical protein [Bacteroidales bacterium]
MTIAGEGFWHGLQIRASGFMTTPALRATPPKEGNFIYNLQIYDLRFFVALLTICESFQHF